MAWSSSEWLPVSRRPLTAMRWTPFCGGVGSILSWLITASLQTRGPGGGRRGGPGGRTRLDRMAGFAKDVCVLPAQLNRVSALRCGGDAAESFRTGWHTYSCVCAYLPGLRASLRSALRVCQVLPPPGSWRVEGGGSRPKAGTAASDRLGLAPPEARSEGGRGG